jgi:DNA-directed RNA polymerase specialized sigma24 family protein
VATRTARPRDTQTVACPCRHGDVPAEMAGQRPLLERAAAGDREAFARLYEDQVEGAYRYLLAWTGDRAEAAELTGQVFHNALAWLPATAGGEGEAGAWLIAMARDAVAQRRGSGWIAGPAGPEDAPASDAVAAVARLGDPEREVVVLRLLLGHSLAHTAHLSGYSRRAVLELQLAACLTVWDLTGGARAGPTPTTRPTPSAEEFERRLGRWEINLTGSDPTLADALAAAGSLRRAIPGYVVAPDDELVQRLRRELLTDVAVGPSGQLAQVAVDNPTQRAPEPAVGGGGPDEAREDAAQARATRRHWVATGVATAGIVVVLALQAFGRSGPPSACGGQPCPAPTTVVAAAGGGGLGPPLTTVRPSTTTTSTLPDQTSAPTTARSSAATVPATTRPATSAAPTTRAPRPPTTTRRPTTTAPPTTAATTTTAAPAPT